MKGFSPILKIAGIVFGLLILIGIIGTLVSEIKVPEVKENVSKEVVLKACDFYGCEKEGDKRCSSVGMFGNIEICKVDEEKKCLRWVIYETCSKGCKNATCIEKLSLEPCPLNGCNKTDERKCEFNSVYVCKLDESSWCLRWEYNTTCSYGCENGKCIQQEETTTTTVPLKYIVTRVIDGDTFELNTGDRVRLILIDAPESNEKCYLEAKTRLQQLVLNKEVRLEKDVSETDKYGRLLRYVYVDSIFVNYQLVREGLAYAYPYPPDVKYQAQIEQAEQLAKQEATGCLWKTEEETTLPPEQQTPENCIYISYFHYDAEGDDRYNLNDEYVTFKNKCNVSFNMTSWKIKDEANHTYTFPTFTFNPLTSFTLYTGSGTDTSDKLYWNSDSPIWNNDHDTLYLYDDTNKLILSYSY
jgi:endonuclease YncB( thermonuclease family)